MLDYKGNVRRKVGFAKLERSEDINVRKRDTKKFTESYKLVYTLIKGHSYVESCEDFPKF